MAGGVAIDVERWLQSTIRGMQYCIEIRSYIIHVGIVVYGVLDNVRR
jgi:hypothetical protein